MRNIGLTTKQSITSIIYCLKHELELELQLELIYFT